MEIIPLESGNDVCADATTSVPHMAPPPLHPSDVELIAAWGASLRADGYAVSSIEGAAKRLETFARRLPDGLLRATKRDVFAFYEDREALARRRQAAQQAVGLHPVRIPDRGAAAPGTGRAHPDDPRGERPFSALADPGFLGPRIIRVSSRVQASPGRGPETAPLGCGIAHDHLG